VEHKEAIPILNPVIDNNSYPTDEFKILPTLYSVLDDKKVCLANQITWQVWSTELELNVRNISMGKPAEKNPNEFLIKKDNVIEMIRKSNSSDCPLLFSYKEEICDLIQSSDFVFFKPIGKDLIPIKFASIESKPVIVMGTICSDTIFNNVNTLLNTPKKRASAFIQKNVLPELLEKDIFYFIRNTPFEYIGLVYIYGNRNFIDEDDILSSTESLCIVISLKDYSPFIKRELSQEEFLKKCFVFLKSEGSNFIKVELVLN
jgi:hypothetical protein